jgi:SSS family solute:Na+ symporter
MLLGVISTVWFFIGGVIDTRRLFKDLVARVDNPLDDGRVEGHVSLMDKALLGSDDDNGNDNK